MAPAELKTQIPGISGTRALNDNLSDMKAQVASNFKGIGLVHALIEEYTLEVVQAYMHHIQVPSSLTPPAWYATLGEVMALLYLRFFDDLYTHASRIHHLGVSITRACLAPTC